MLQIFEGTRENPSEMKCSCGEKVYLTIHHDFIEGKCGMASCGKQFAIKLDKIQIWNCCSEPENGCGFKCKNKIHNK